MSRKYAGMNPKSHQNLEVVWKKSQQRKWKKKKHIRISFGEKLGEYDATKA